MINHFGPAPADGEKSPTSSNKKLDKQKSNVTGDSGVSFKQSFKP